MGHREATITVSDTSEQVIRVELTTEDVNGVETKYNLTGAELRFLIKNNLFDADTAKIAEYSTIGAAPKLTIVAPATNGLVDVALDDVDIPTPGTYRYRLDVRRGTAWETLLTGPLRVEPV